MFNIDIEAINPLVFINSNTKKLELWAYNDNESTYKLICDLDITINELLEKYADSNSLRLKALK